MKAARQYPWAEEQSERRHDSSSQSVDYPNNWNHCLRILTTGEDFKVPMFLFFFICITPKLGCVLVADMEKSSRTTQLWYLKERMRSSADGEN